MLLLPVSSSWRRGWPVGKPLLVSPIIVTTPPSTKIFIGEKPCKHAVSWTTLLLYDAVVWLFINISDLPQSHSVVIDRSKSLQVTTKNERFEMAEI